MKEELVEKALGEPYDKEKMEKLFTLICSAPFPLLALHHTLEKKASNAIKQSHKELESTVREKIYKAILKEVNTLWVFGQGVGRKGLYTDEKFRGPNEETASWIKKEDVLEVLNLIHSNNKSNESSKN